MAGCRADTFDVFGDASTISADLDAMTEVISLIEARKITSVLQPIVRMSNREIIGYEALARGPIGTRWESPIELFCAAAAIGRSAELDWVCRAAAVEAALAADLPRSALLFVNTEPAACVTPCPLDLRPIIARAARKLRLVLELTERVVSHAPVSLLSAARAARDAGFGVALDNLGGDPAVLALLPVVRPDVVKLDPYLLYRPLGADTARMVEAINDYADSSGAVVAAVGVENDSQLRLARAMGATIGQGWLFGRPSPLVARPWGPSEPLLPVGSTRSTRSTRLEELGRTPFETVAAQRPISLASTAKLMPIAHRLEAVGLDPIQPAMVLTSLRPAQRFTADMWDWYAALAGRTALVAIGGAELGGVTVPGATVTGLCPTDRLGQEWDVIVLGPRCNAALVSRVAGRGRREFVVTYNRELVIAAAQAFLRRFG